MQKRYTRHDGFGVLKERLRQQSARSVQAIPRSTSQERPPSALVTALIKIKKEL